MWTLRSIPPSLRRPTIHEIVTSVLTPSVFRACKPRHILNNAFPRSRQFRSFHFSSTNAISHPSRPPRSRDRGPFSTESTRTGLSALDVLGGVPVPSTSIVACLWDGFHLNNGMKITDGAGVLLVGGEAFGWRPWDMREKGGANLLNGKGQWEVPDEAWGVLELVWPKPGMYTHL